MFTRASTGLIGAGTLALTAFFVLAAVPTGASCIALLKPSDGPPFVDCNFGIEQWEGGKRRDERYQQWHLKCESPAQGQPSCELQRTIYVMWSKDMGGAWVDFDRHSTADGTLHLVNGRWQEGTLDFDVSIGTVTKDVLHVAMRLDVKDRFATLKSFKAMGVGRAGAFSLPDGNLEAVEFKIPEYTYTVNVPITLEGIRSEDDKRYDDMANGLSAEDRTAWHDGKCLATQKPSTRQLLKQLPPGLQKKAKAAKQESDLTPTENARVRQAAQGAFLQELDMCLRDDGMSEEGRQRVIKFVRAEAAE